MYNTENLAQNQQKFAHVIQNINRELQEKGTLCVNSLVVNVVILSVENGLFCGYLIKFIFVSNFIFFSMDVVAIFLKLFKFWFRFI